jgi:tetratricopeptide (TPR) repeat protein
VLNYLGYSLVEMKTNLDEALDMIERAVAGEPDSGYIVDSLGWVLYRLGRYDEALVQMERAVELLPVDPVLNDHLGDVYWAVGRKREAEFQWHRALSFIGPAIRRRRHGPHPPQARGRARRVLETRGGAAAAQGAMTRGRVFAPAKVNLDAACHRPARGRLSPARQPRGLRRRGRPT